MAWGLEATMAEARRAQHGQIHPRNSAQGQHVIQIIPISSWGTMESGSNSSCVLPAVDAALALVPLFVLRRHEEEI